MVKSMLRMQLRTVHEFVRSWRDEFAGCELICAIEDGKRVIRVNSADQVSKTGFSELTLNDEMAIVDYNGESRPLGDVVGLDPEFNVLITEFNKKYDALKPQEKEVAEEN